jgi:hypothetical protein
MKTLVLKPALNRSEKIANIVVGFSTIIADVKHNIETLNPQRGVPSL